MLHSRTFNSVFYFIYMAVWIFLYSLLSTHLAIKTNNETTEAKNKFLAKIRETKNMPQRMAKRIRMSVHELYTCTNQNSINEKCFILNISLFFSAIALEFYL